MSRFELVIAMDFLFFGLTATTILCSAGGRARRDERQSRLSHAGTPGKHGDVRRDMLVVVANTIYRILGTASWFVLLLGYPAYCFGVGGTVAIC